MDPVHVLTEKGCDDNEVSPCMELRVDYGHIHEGMLPPSTRRPAHRRLHSGMEALLAGAPSSFPPPRGMER
jgi:hypothetical protein